MELEDISNHGELSLRILTIQAPYTENVNEKMIYEATAIIPAFPDTIATFVDYFSTGNILSF